MESQYNDVINWLEHYPQLYTLIALTALILGAWIANWVVKRILIRGLTRLLRATPLCRDQSLHQLPIISLLPNLVAALILSVVIDLVPRLPVTVLAIVRNVCGAVVILTSP